jgi:hypothetical protein
VNGKQPLTILRSKPALPVMELVVSVAAIVTEQDGDEIYKPKYLAYSKQKFVPDLSTVFLSNSSMFIRKQTK